MQGNVSVLLHKIKGSQDKGPGKLEKATFPPQH